ncbi:MAG: (d)CMP kinase [Candidatus Omnitrophica bacterium]|nr:(d)CMP kinase [Candidatus Omnitrophota bacterium]
MQRLKHLVITLDGPAGAGKSTIAKCLAKRLGISYLDTGAMYRALTLKALRLKVNLEDEEALAVLAQKTVIAFTEVSDSSLHVTLDGEDVAEAIRSSEVTNNTFYIARAGKVRELMVRWQQAIGQAHSIVTDGRDQGTVAFPKATYKFYVDANFEERVGRRMRELEEAGKTVDFEELKKDMQERDHKDFTRAVGPLKKADDAITIDSTYTNVEQTVEMIIKYIK